VGSDGKKTPFLGALGEAIKTNFNTHDLLKDSD